jgi:hypothetical protein
MTMTDQPDAQRINFRLIPFDQLPHGIGSALPATTDQVFVGGHGVPSAGTTLSLRVRFHEGWFVVG